MKRNLDLIRAIMLRIESSSETSFDAYDFLDLCTDKSALHYNIYLMYDAGFIEALEVEILQSSLPVYRILWLTNYGCEYLDTVREPSVWQKTQTALQSVGGSAPLDIVKSVAGSLLTKYLETYLQT